MQFQGQIPVKKFQEKMVLLTTSYIIAIGSEAYKVFFIDVTLEGT